MTIYEFIEKNSEFGKELFSIKEAILLLRKMNDEEKLIFLKEWDEKRKPKPIDKKPKKVHNKKNEKS